MPVSEDLFVIVERIINHHESAEDLETLRLLIGTNSSHESLQIGKYGVNVGQGQDIHIGDKIYQGADAETIREIIAPLIRELQLRESVPSQKAANAVKYIPHTGVSHFVGRSKELTKIHEKLHQQNAVVISAVAGMGGVGKTELVIKYALEHEADYPGGICWLSARDANLAAGIIQFVQLHMGLKVPQKDFHENPLTLNQQVGWCWQNWQPLLGLVLVVFDDVTNLENLSELLPTNNRFRVLMTTRLRNLNPKIEEIPLDVLSPNESLEFLINLVGKKKVNKELATAKELCQWLGYLPLGIELVGRHLVKKPPHWTLAQILEQLQQQRIHDRATIVQQKILSPVQTSVLAAFELSWVELNPTTQKIAVLLSLFAGDIFVWKWVESTAKLLNWHESDVELAIEQLYQRHLVQCVEEKNTCYYKIHPLIREFLQIKSIEISENSELKQAFSSTFVEIARSIPYPLTLNIINSVKNAIPHLAEVAENLIDAVGNENLYWTFTGLARFYGEQGLYGLAETWYQRCVSAVKSRLGEKHPDFAGSLNNLARIYISQGKYETAESLCLEALELRKQLLGENHPYFATSLSSLAELYKSQGKYEAAEPLFIQVLDLLKKQNHPCFAASLSSLAGLYKSQGKYELAEILYLKALDLEKHRWDKNDRNVVASLDSLAELYRSQERYTEAEPIYIESLELGRRLLGEQHPINAIVLNNLALLKYDQGYYEEAEKFALQSLELDKLLLGEEHPDFATDIHNLALIYRAQNRYREAEELFLKSLEIKTNTLVKGHPLIADTIYALGFMYRLQERYIEAEPLCLRALELDKYIWGENHLNVVRSLDNLAELYCQLQRYEEAEFLYQQALGIIDRILEPNHPKTIAIREKLESLRTQQ
jgi:tetratricopeptide (TPR) repeat protein